MLRHGVQPTQVYDSDSALEGHDDEQERQEPPKTAQQTRVGARSPCFELGVVRCSLFSLRVTNHSAPLYLQTSKIRSFRIRTVSTFVLIGSFLGFVWAGHVPLMLMIFLIQVSSIAYHTPVTAVHQPMLV